MEVTNAITMQIYLEKMSGHRRNPTTAEDRDDKQDKQDFCSPIPLGYALFWTNKVFEFFFFYVCLLFFASINPSVFPRLLAVAIFLISSPCRLCFHMIVRMYCSGIFFFRSISLAFLYYCPSSDMHLVVLCQQCRGSSTTMISTGSRPALCWIASNIQHIIRSMNR